MFRFRLPSCCDSSGASVALFVANLAIGCESTFFEQRHTNVPTHSQLQSWNVPRRSAAQTQRHGPVRQLRFFPCMSSHTILFFESGPILIALLLGGCVQSLTKLRCELEILISVDLAPNPCRTTRQLSDTVGKLRTYCVD